MVVEGGWASASYGSAFSSTPTLQAQYIDRQSQLLDSARAIAVFQLSFCDINLNAWGLPPSDSTLLLFNSIGLTDSTLAAKPALARWDSVFARKVSP